MTPIIDNATLDHLIPADVRARADRERARWEQRRAKFDAEFDGLLPEEESDPLYHDQPYETEYIKWAEVAVQLRERAEDSPGRWVRLRSNAKMRRAAELIRGKAIPALEGLAVQAFARPARPRSDGQPVGWEIYARVRPA